MLCHSSRMQNVCPAWAFRWIVFTTPRPAAAMLADGFHSRRGLHRTIQKCAGDAQTRKATEDRAGIPIPYWLVTRKDASETLTVRLRAWRGGTGVHGLSTVCLSEPSVGMNSGAQFPGVSVGSIQPTHVLNQPNLALFPPRRRDSRCCPPYSVRTCHACMGSCLPTYLGNMSVVPPSADSWTTAVGQPYGPHRPYFWLTKSPREAVISGPLRSVPRAAAILCDSLRPPTWKRHALAAVLRVCSGTRVF